MLGHTKSSSRAISLQQACTVVPQNYVKFCFESAIQPPSLVSVLLPDHSTGWMLVHGDAHPPALPPDGASGTAATKDHHVFSRVAESLLLSHSPTAIRNCGPSNTYHDREPKNYWCPSLLSPAHTFVSYMHPLKSERSFLLWAKLLLSVTVFASRITSQDEPSNFGSAVLQPLERQTYYC